MAIKHVEDKYLGTFDYDTKIWLYLPQGSMGSSLRLKKNYKGPISLPKGIKHCKNMFRGADLTGCWFEDFDTSDIDSMLCMFDSCKFPAGFTLGDNLIRVM